ncbi:MAG: hypothetical protein NTW12_09100 [Deltaproteobacteria bacterium]|nr:hypothetical protein [Deltaproteobacteria bacterium]
MAKDVVAIAVSWVRTSTSMPIRLSVLIAATFMGQMGATCTNAYAPPAKVEPWESVSGRSKKANCLKRNNRYINMINVDFMFQGATSWDRK